MSKMTQQKRDKIPDKQFAFPKEEKEPLEDAAHVRNAIARFNQVEGVTDAEREEAWKRIHSRGEEIRCRNEGKPLARSGAWRQEHESRELKTIRSGGLPPGRAARP